MDILNTILLGILGFVGSLWLGGMQFKVNKLEKELDMKISKDTVREIINDKLEVQAVQLAEVKSDIEKIDHKLDRLIEKS